MKTNLNVNFGERLRLRRISANYTQEKLAELAGVSPQHIQRLEGKNPSGVTLETTKKLADAFKIPLSEFLEDV